MTAGAPTATVVLDIGKTNIRLCAIGGDGRPLEALERPNTVRPGPPYPHFDVDELFEWILEGLRSLASAFEVRAVVPVTHGAAAALLAGKDLALPVLDYEHGGPDEISESYDREARDFTHTLSPGLPAGLNLGRQLAWLERRHPEDFARVTHALPYPQYWAWRLTGVTVSEVTSLGCHTDLWEPGAGRFSGLARGRGWDRLFPPLVPAWKPLGPPLELIRHRTGLGSSCRVLAGIHDSNASFLTHRAFRNHAFTVVSTGTWIVCMARGGRLETLREERDTLANVDAFGDPVPCARFMGGREYAALAGADGLDADPSPEDAAAVVEAGSMALPAFTAQGGPFRRLDGRVIGPPPSNGAGRAALAAVYCALVTDYCLDLLGAEGDLVIEGRFARNRAYLAGLAGMRRQQAVWISTDDTGTVAGAALLSGLPEHLPTERPSLDRVAQLAFPGLAAYRDRWRSLLDSSGRRSPATVGREPASRAGPRKNGS
jgi:sugar (pentulose or hexulose) kinase